MLRLAAHHPRDTEIQQLDQVRPGPRLGDHDVVGLQVAVQDAQRVRRGQRVRRLAHNVRRADVVDDLFAIEDRGERFAFDKLHRQVDQALGSLAEIIDARDVRVRDLAGVLRLAVEAADGGGILGEPGAHHLDGHFPLHPDVLRQVHLAHATFAELPIHQVPVGEERPRQRVARVLEDQRRAIEGAESIVPLVPGTALRAELRAHLMTAGGPFGCDALTLACVTGRS